MIRKKRQKRREWTIRAKNNHFLMFKVVFIFTLIAVTATCFAEDPPINIPTSPNLRLQILLDRAGYSPGEIDGSFGKNTIKALAAFQKSHHLKPTARADSATLKALSSLSEQPLLKRYTITEKDTMGPFVRKFPKDLQEWTKLPRTDYTSPLELLGEVFHINPIVLRKWNPKAKYKTGETIFVPNVTSLDDLILNPVENGEVTVYVSKKNSDVLVRNGEGKVILYAPVTQGDNLAPLPLGKYTVTKIEDYPYFHYNPKLFSRPNKKHKGGLIAPGPNNPVGIVWIDLSLDHYGLHGTPAPEKIGHTASNGCIRMTNWDAFRLSTMVMPGTPVHFVK